MKKFFRKAFLALSVMCMSGALSSCDQAAVQQIVTNVASTLLTGMQGQAKSYTGKATSLSMTGSANKSTWNAINSKNANTISSMTATLQQSGTSTGTIVIPAYTDGKVTVNKITISNLTLSSSNGQASTSITVGDNSTIDGTIVVNGTTYTAANLYIESAAATTTSLSLKMTIYYASTSDGDDYSKAINFTYTGTAASN